MRNLKFIRGKLGCEIDIFGEALEEDGNAVVAARFRGEGFFQESGRLVMDRDGRAIKMAGRLLIEGDVAPGVDFIGAGEVRVALSGGVRTMKIYDGGRGRGMDGEVSHTVLRLR